MNKDFALWFHPRGYISFDRWGWDGYRLWSPPKVHWFDPLTGEVYLRR